MCNGTPDAVKSGHLCLFTAPANQPHPLPALWKTASIFHPYHQMVKWLPCCVSLACCPDTAMPTYSFTPLRLSILASLGSHLCCSLSAWIQVSRVKPFTSLILLPATWTFSVSFHCLFPASPWSRSMVNTFLINKPLESSQWDILAMSRKGGSAYCCGYWQLSTKAQYCVWLLSMSNRSTNNIH